MAEKTIHLSKKSLKANKKGKLSPTQLQMLKDFRLLSRLSLVGLILVVFGILYTAAIGLWIAWLPLLFWLWLLRHSGRDIRAITRDIKAGEADFIEGTITYDIQFTPGLIRLSKFRFEIEDMSFAVDRKILFLFQNQETYRIYYAPHSEIFLGAVALHQPDQTPSQPFTPDPDLMAQFTERELEVLTLMAQGMSNKEIANELHLSVNTIKMYASELYSKLDVRRRTQAVAEARKIGLLPLE